METANSPLYDVIVVGAGFAGLNAARLLGQARQRVLVLEARERVGGRVCTEQLGGATIDLGAQWLGARQRRLETLAAELGVRTFPTYVAGDHLRVLHGRTRRYRGTIPPLGPFALASVGWTLRRLNALGRTIPPEAPWHAPRAHDWDGLTLHTWLARNCWSRAGRDLCTAALESVFACGTRDISLLHALFYIRAAGSVELLVDTDGGAQQARFADGAQMVARRMAEGIDIVFGAPVRHVAQSGTSVALCAGDRSFAARRCIVAIPPTLSGRIEYAPALPAARDQLTQRVPMGSVLKCFAVYERAFWRQRGLSGQTICDRGPVTVTSDGSPESGTPGVLIGFVEAEAARQLVQQPEADRQKAVLQCFARFFGPEASTPLHYRDKCWADEPWSRGCFVGHPSPGTWTSFGAALRAPVGRIHWAGTETATEWCGYIEGALQSGERAAHEALCAAMGEPANMSVIERSARTVVPSG
jgi:monoamine oxidase